MLTLKRLNKLAGTLKESHGLPGYDAWKTSGPPEVEMEECPMCDGTGEVPVTAEDEEGSFEAVELCPVCKGTGWAEKKEEPTLEPDNFMDEASGNDIFPPEPRYDVSSNMNPQSSAGAALDALQNGEVVRVMGHSATPEQIRAKADHEHKHLYDLASKVEALAAKAKGDKDSVWRAEDEEMNKHALGEPKF